MREHDITYIYADEMPKLEAMLRQSVAGRSWVSTSIHRGRERWKFCRFEAPDPFTPKKIRTELELCTRYFPKPKILYAGKE